MKNYVSVWVYLILLFLTLSANPSFSAISSEIAKLERGEVITKKIPSFTQGGIPETQAIVLINASTEKVWGFLEKSENFPKFIDKLESMEVIENKEKYQKVKARIKIAGFLPRLDYILLMDKTNKNKLITFKKIGGTIKHLDGAIELKPHNNATILTYKMHVVSGIYIPEFIKRRGLKKDLPKIMRAIRREAEKS